MRNRETRIAFALLGLFLLLLFADLGLWFHREYRRGRPPLLAAGEAKKFAAIAVLAGGPGRIRAGIDLWQQGRAATLLIIGSNPRTTRRNIVDLYFTRDDVPSPDRQAAILVENRSRNTLGNIRALRRLCRRHRFSSLVIVTSDFHLQRVYNLCRRLLPADLEVRYYPVPGRLPAAESPWTAAKEFLKYLNALPRVLDGR